jgi:hypothetical protein
MQTLYKKLLILSTQMLGEMEQLFLQNRDPQQENSKTKLKLVKLVLMYQFQSHYLCSLSQETKNHSMET